MIVHDDGILYRIFDSEVKFYADETAYGWNVVAEYNDKYYNLGNESVGIELAVSFWQEQNDKILSQDELKQIMVSNQLIAKESECHGSEENKDEEVGGEKVNEETEEAFGKEGN